MLNNLSGPVAQDILVAEPNEGDIPVLIVEDHALLANTLVIALSAEGCRARIADYKAPDRLILVDALGSRQILS